MDYQNSPSIGNSEIEEIKRGLESNRRFRGGVNWFFWISGLSIVNTISFFLGWDRAFVIGLGITQVIDGIVFEIAREMGSGSQIVLAIGFILDFFLTGIFIACGILGRKFKRWAIITGMVFYALDAVMVFLLEAYMEGAFHLFALFWIWMGLRAYNDQAKLVKMKTEYGEFRKDKINIYDRPSQ